MQHETLANNFTPDKINSIQANNTIGSKGNDKPFGRRILCLSSCGEVVEIMGSNIVLENPVEPFFHFISVREVTLGWQLLFSIATLHFLFSSCGLNFILLIAN
jgi:hypothetical protein